MSRLGTTSAEATEAALSWISGKSDSKGARNTLMITPPAAKKRTAHTKPETRRINRTSEI